mgnify:CR=1 FL=1
MKDCNCIFCKIANGEIPSSTVYEDEDFRVILDLGPAAKGHALILPKEHFKDVYRAGSEDCCKSTSVRSETRNRNEEIPGLRRLQPGTE